MWDEIRDISKDIATHLGDFILYIYDLAPYVAIPAIILLAYGLYLLFRQPMQLLGAVVLVLAVWFVAMPGGLDSAKTIWGQDQIEPKYRCIKTLGGELDYWKGYQNPELACDKPVK